MTISAWYMDDDTEGDQRLPHRRSQLRSADVSTEFLDKLVLDFSNNSVAVCC
jgi:hypothetical protein